MKKTSKRLTVNRETVRNLENDAMAGVAAAGTIGCTITCRCPYTQYRCPSNDPYGTCVTIDCPLK